MLWLSTYSCLFLGFIKCPDSASKKDLMAYLQRINLYCHQLNITSKVKADVQNISGELIVSGVRPSCWSSSFAFLLNTGVDVMRVIVSLKVGLDVWIIISLVIDLVIEKHKDWTIDWCITNSVNDWINELNNSRRIGYDSLGYDSLIEQRKERLIQWMNK